MISLHVDHVISSRGPPTGNIDIDNVETLPMFYEQVDILDNVRINDHGKDLAVKEAHTG